MKPEPRPAIHIEKKLVWGHKWGREESLGISKVDQIVLARFMEFQIWPQLTSSVEGGFRERTMASACLDARHFGFFLYVTGAFQAAILVL